MRRRILTAILGVTVLATSVLTVPLLFIVSGRARDRGVRELERVAERVAPEVTPESLTGADDLELPDMHDAVIIGVYLPDGTRVAGHGPDPGGDLVKDVRMVTLSARVGSALVVARPVVAEDSHNKVGVIRVSEPLSETIGQARKDQVLLLLFDLIAIVIATSVGWYLATRLVRPVEQIRNDAVRLGRGDFAIRERTSGIRELDATSIAMADTAGRLEDTLRREREFTSNASHQLRTPLTALKLAIEGELLSPREDSSLVLGESLNEIERLESTIETLLDVARRRTTARLPLDATDWMDSQRQRWSDRIRDEDRDVEFHVVGTAPLHASREVLDEISDILIDNAIRHGDGTILVRVELGSESLTLSVSDEGALGRDPTDLFVRNDPSAAGNGIGLALARSLAEGEGGRLVVASTDPTEFRATLPDWNTADRADHYGRP